MDAIQNKNIGSLIREKIAEKSMTVAEFARSINRERTTVYDIFKRETVDFDLLSQISEVLDYDFIHEVYFPKNTGVTPSKMLIVIEIDEDKLEKLNLPEDCVRLVRFVRIEK